MNDPVPFEVEFPEAGQALMEICQERAEKRSRGFRSKPLYLDAVEPIVAEKKTGRNDPCPCGSGNKFKKCCGK